MLLICLSFSLVFAANEQKIYDVHGEEYQDMCMLYISQGMAVPSSSGPWSGAELRMMLEKIDRKDLKGAEQSIYEGLLKTLDIANTHRISEDLAMTYDSTIAIEAYAHTNTDSYADESLWRYDYEERQPFYTGSFETWAGEMFYGDFEFLLTLNPARDDSTGSLFGESTITTNIPVVPPSELNDLNMNMPYNAFGSVGGDHWNLQIGRDNLSWGSGETGNLMLGGHLLYQEFVKFTTFHPSYKFTSVYSFFPHPDNYNNDEGQETSVSGLRFFAGHRLEFRLFDDRVNLNISESMMYMSEDNSISLGVLNPFMLYHDNYIRANSNSMLAIEVEASPADNWFVYGQFAVDEFPLPGETSDTSNAHPTALGFLGGVKAVYPISEGFFYGNLEAAYTDPYLYLRNNGGVGNFDVNYVVGIRSFSPSGNIYVLEDFLGYEYGCDAIVLNLTGGYESLNDFYVEGTLFGMLHGVNNMDSLWLIGTDAFNASTPLSTPISDPDNDGDSIETTLLAELKGGYAFNDSWDVYGQIDAVWKKNFQNIAANGTESDIQVSVGTTYEF